MLDEREGENPAADCTMIHFTTHPASTNPAKIAA